MAFPEIPRLSRSIPAAKFRPSDGAVYFHGSNSEARSAHISAWAPSATAVEFVAVSSASRAAMDLTVSGQTNRVSLRSEVELASSTSVCAGRDAYVDITGLPFHVWAPLVRTLLITSGAALVSAVYAEPERYLRAPNPVAGVLFDLSLSLDGLAPLPGFASLRSRPGGAVVVPILGFEGARLSYVLNELEPADDSVHPIVGVPGFRPEYPFFSLLGNRKSLLEDLRFANVRFAKANCPFDLALRLAAIDQELRPDSIQVAPIGTKPHALGALLFVLANPDRTEIIYDHPVRSASRTAGTGQIGVYPLTGFIDNCLSMA